MSVHALDTPIDKLSVPRLPIWLIDDDCDTSRRKLAKADGAASHITVRLHTIEDSTAELAESWRYRPGSLRTYDRTDIALELLTWARAKQGIVVAGPNFATGDLAATIASRHLDFLFEIKPSWATPAINAGSACDIKSATWTSFEVGASIRGQRRGRVSIARLGGVQIWGQCLELFALAPGGLVDSSLVRYSVCSRPRISPEHVAGLLSWLRRIRVLDRRAPRSHHGSIESSRRPTHSIGQPLRPNIQLATVQDVKLLGSLAQLPLSLQSAHAAEKRRSDRSKTVVELFAGAGLLGLGFLQSQLGTYRITFSGELDPVYAATLTINHSYISDHFEGHRSAVPAVIKPVDLRRRSAFEMLLSRGRPDILIGGPPCQGFSNANRNSWDPSNPNNLLVDTFLKYVRALEPSAVVLENVQGILWTPKAGAQARTSTAHHIIRSLERAGYDVSARLLDAAWYGVPQRRTRFFLIALSRATGIASGDLGDWGPFPRPTHGHGLQPCTTVRQAIGDLPSIGNGSLESELPYREREPVALKSNPYLKAMRTHGPQGVITDHITSKQADYVIDRYKQIPPGGNWEDIADLLTNYSDVQRTHSNIYRRLRWDEPAVTIGHYRKSMIVHPEQDRGLSLREASRLQSIPDWFRFSGSPSGRVGGLMHKQQQVANAVSPMVAKAIAERLTELL